jgi:glyoxylase-like metal-dependent hydrolase (beta-lactamase superfamily II)
LNLWIKLDISKQQKTNDLYKMKLHQIEGYIQSIYLVEYSEKLLLLDGCCRADVETIKTFITEELQRPFSDLKLIVVTHMHPDHAGAAHVLRKKTGCKIATANVSGHWYTGVDGLLMHFTDMALTRWVAKRKNKSAKKLWYSSKLKPDIKINDGEVLPGFAEWQVIYTQGHTDRDISLLHQPSQLIYVADLMVEVKGRLIPPFPIFYPNRYKSSLTKINNLQPKSILLAHGGEVQLSDDDYQHLLSKAPDLPLTHWRSIKTKLRKTFT